MMNVALLLPADYQLSSVATILELLEAVNDIQISNGEKAPFKIQLVQSPAQESQNGSEFHSHRVKTTRSRVTFDLVLIPALKKHQLKSTVEKNRALVPWLQNQFRNDAEIASFCTGAFLFAESGLLNGRLATTHMDVCADFVLAYPLVFVKPGRTLTVDWNCYTSGGATSSFHLLLYLVQKFCGSAMAVKISKMFSIEPDQYHQSYFSTFRPVYTHKDDLIGQIQKQLEKNYLSIRTIEEVTSKYPSSRRNILRRFTKATGVSPLQYLQNIRVEKAKHLLEGTHLGVSEIISLTGYTDPKSFRKIFVKLVGITPLEYRAKFRMGGV